MLEGQPNEIKPGKSKQQKKKKARLALFPFLSRLQN